MADVITNKTASGLIYTGKGALAGVVLTGAAAGRATFYDNTAGNGTVIFDAYIPAYVPIIVFFSDRFAPRFVSGLYVVIVGATTTVVAWTEQK